MRKILIALFIGLFLNRSASAKWHIVKPGENLSVIANEHGVSLKNLAMTNSKVPPYQIYGGERLWLGQLDLMPERIAKASHYGDGDGFDGELTASRKVFSQYGNIMAHRTFPFGTIVSICYGGIRKEFVVEDRGPYPHMVGKGSYNKLNARKFDLPSGAAKKMGLGTDLVTYKVIFVPK